MARIMHKVNVSSDNRRFSISSIQDAFKFVIWDMYAGKRFWIECDTQAEAMNMIRWSDTEWMEWLDSQKAYE